MACTACTAHGFPDCETCECEGDCPECANDLKNTIWDGCAISVPPEDIAQPSDTGSALVTIERARLDELLEIERQVKEHDY